MGIINEYPIEPLLKKWQIDMSADQSSPVINSKALPMPRFLRARTKEMCRLTLMPTRTLTTADDVITLLQVIFVAIHPLSCHFMEHNILK
jgi:hypothetical protein